MKSPTAVAVREMWSRPWGRPVHRRSQPIVDEPRADRSPASRAWWTVVGITFIFWAFQLFGYVDLRPWVALPVVLLGAWGLATVAASWTTQTPNRRLAGTLAWGSLAVAVLALLLWSYLQILTAPAYGTDEIAFDQYAAQLLVHGLNPYAHSMAPAMALFHLPPNAYTFQLDGHPVTALSYPSLAFLVYAPFLLAGWSTQMAVVVNVLAWGAGIVLAFWLLPKPVRPMAIVVGSLGTYIGYAVGGVTDALFVPLLIGAVYRWDRFGSTHGLRAWRGPILLGLAMAVKQTPWLVLPFLVAGIGLEGWKSESVRRGCTNALRYLGIVLGAFLVPNLPFVILSAHQWVHGVLTPITSQTVPAGQGVVGLSLFLGIGGGSLAAYSAMVLVVLVALLAAFVVTYPASKTWAVVCPAVILFFSGRSFGSYLVNLLPAAAVAAFTVQRGIVAGRERHDAQGIPWAERRRPRVGRAVPWRHGRWALGGGVLAVFVALAVVLTSRPPLSVRITSVSTSGQLATVVVVGVEVTNHTGTPQRPSFSVESGGVLTAFWVARGGPPLVPPHRSVHYTLLSPNFPSQPPVTGGFQVVAFTSHPGTLSRSGSFVPTVLHVGLTPSAVSAPVPLGRPVTLQAQLLDNLDRPVTRTGVPVYLGQVIYAQAGLEYSQAVINDAQQGQTPVVAYTNGRGIATFVVKGTQSSTDPVYFEANLVSSTQFYPFGYSEILPIRFESP